MDQQKRTFNTLDVILKSEVGLERVGPIEIPIIVPSAFESRLHYIPRASGLYSPPDGSYLVMVIVHDSLDNFTNSISRTGGQTIQIEFDYNNQIAHQNAELISLTEIKRLLAPATDHLGYYSPLAHIGRDVEGIGPFNSRTFNLRMGYYKNRSESLIIHELIKVLRTHDQVIRALPK